MADALQPLWTLVRLLHIASGIALVGGATMWGVLIQPTLAQLGPTLPKGVMPTLGGKVVRFLPHAGLATFVTGVLVYWHLMPYANATYQMIMGLALLVMLVSLALSFLVVVPSFKKAMALMTAAQGPPPPEALALMGRLKQASLVTLALAWFIVVLMVVGTATRVGIA